MKTVEKAGYSSRNVYAELEERRGTVKKTERYPTLKSMNGTLFSHQSP